jgi:hypothetical protein
LAKTQSIVTLKYDFNFIAKTYTFKIKAFGVKKEPIFGRDFGGDMLSTSVTNIWRNYTMPGNAIVFNVTNNTNRFELTVNGFSFGSFPSELFKVKSMSYGGQLTTINGIIKKFVKVLEKPNDFLMISTLYDSSIEFDNSKPVPFTCDESYVKHR